MKLRFPVIAVLMSLCFILNGCQPTTSFLRSSIHLKPDSRWVKFLESGLGTDWYGIYLQGNKIGYLKSAVRREAGSSGPCYLIQLSGIVHMRTQGGAETLEMDIISEFSARPPYSLTHYSSKNVKKDDVSQTSIDRMKDGGYRIRITQGQDTRIRTVETFDYTLMHYTAVQRWITQSPDVGDSIRHIRFDSETFELEETISRVKATRHAFVAGVKKTYYEISTVDADGLEILEVFGSDGKAYSIAFGGLFECRLEPQALAVQIDTQLDLFVTNTVPIDQPLGDLEKITFLELSIDAQAGGLFDDAPGQSVRRNLGDDRYILTLTPASGSTVIATPEEVQKNLRATADIPAHHPKIVSLARKAVGNSNTTAASVNRLVKFVCRYIEDDYSANPLTVMDAVKKRKGDCSEHAAMFTAMARSLKIPCRTVGGLVYLGDELKSFGLHAWNEVVIAGRWVSVDPTWGQSLIDATHIRFPESLSEEWQIMAAIPHIKIKVLQVRHKD